MSDKSSDYNNSIESNKKEEKVLGLHEKPGLTINTNLNKKEMDSKDSAIENYIKQIQKKDMQIKQLKEEIHELSEKLAMMKSVLKLGNLNN